MRDQADRLRDLVQADGRGDTGPVGPRSIVISGGRPGVGVSTLAVKLAQAFAAQGRRVVLVDADLRRGEATRLCEVSVEFGLLEVLTGAMSAEQAITQCIDGLHILPSRGGLMIEEENGAEHELMEAALRTLTDEGWLVIVDAGHGLGAWPQRLRRAGDLNWIVTTPHSQSVMDAYAAIKTLLVESPDLAVGTIVNQAEDESAAAEVHERLAHTAWRFLGARIEAAGRVLYDLGLDAESGEQPSEWETSGGAMERDCVRIARRIGAPKYNPVKVA